MSPHSRRKSVDSSSDSSDSSSSSSSSASSSKKKTKNKHTEGKQPGHQHQGGSFAIGSGSGSSLFPHDPIHQEHNQYNPPFVADRMVFNPFHYQSNQNPMSSQSPPPSYGHNVSPPPSGFRVPLSTTSAFPDQMQTGQSPCHDADGSPIFIGSALLDNSVHPCKIGPHLQPHAQVSYGGVEHGHHGRYDLLPFVPQQMEFVHTSHGRIPQGRRPIEGGYEENGTKLYHAVGIVNGIRVPGKTGEHLGGANVSFGGQEIVLSEYEILQVAQFIDYFSS